MLFNSFEFAVFFVVVVAAYWALHRRYRAQNVLLLFASYFFYGWWDVRFLFLIVLSTTVDYCSALMIDRGSLTRAQRVRASAYLGGSALFFLGMRWNAIRFVFFGKIPWIEVEWDRLTACDRWRGVAIGAVLAAVVLANLLYLLADRLNEGTRRKLFVTASICANLSILAVFKYYNFFVESASAFLHSLFGVHFDFGTLHVLLPVGISFYTFQTMSYTIDVYRRRMTATPSIVEFAAYLAFFPQLVAGPIERGEHLLPQFQRRRTANLSDFREGAWLIAWGLFKKMVVADNVAAIVNSTFGPFDKLAAGSAAPEDGMRLLVAVYAFAFQIYCDFSGYSDIARGSAKWMGFDIMVNFRLPYFAVSPSDFWKRWHISLSSWLRDYLYIPLGGNRAGVAKTYRNLVLTMLLGGLWHGAAWTFVLWGAFHGAILVLQRLVGLDGEPGRRPWWRLALQGVIMFHLVCFGWLLFRAQNMVTVHVFLRSILGHPHWSDEAISNLRNLLFYTWFLILFQVVQGVTGTLEPMSRWHWLVRLTVWVIVMMSLLSLSAGGKHEFIYFAF